MQLRTIALALLLSTVLITPSSVEAGPPCACWPVDTGEFPVIDVERRGSEPDVVAAKLLKSLNAELPVLARMENLRRTALALQGKPAQAHYILARLQARVLDAETGKAQSPDKLWFDAGYAVACFTEAGQVSGMDGYRWILRGIKLSGASDKYEGGDGAMHFAAALAVLMPKRRDHNMFGHHLQQMAKAVESDRLLGKNFKRLQKQYPPVLKHFAKKK